MKFNLLFALPLLSWMFGPTSAVCDDQLQKAARLDVQIRVQMDYLLYLPKDYDKHDSWPLMLFLHGGGERGNNVELVKEHGPPQLISAGKAFPFIVVSPQCPEEKTWEPLELMALLDEIESKYKVDADRIYSTGLSMGGVGTCRLAAFAPHRLAAIAPIAGTGEASWARRIVHLPIWVFHGAKDKPASVERAQAMVDALKNHGGDPKLTIYPDADHDCWTETYNNPEFYKWLLAQKRASNK